MRGWGSLQQNVLTDRIADQGSGLNTRPVPGLSDYQWHYKRCRPTAPRWATATGEPTGRRLNRRRSDDRFSRLLWVSGYNRFHRWIDGNRRNGRWQNGVIHTSVWNNRLAPQWTAVLNATATLAASAKTNTEIMYP